VVNWPGKVRSGVSESLVDSTDFLPTVLQAAGQPLAKDHKLDGISFYDHLKDAKSTSPSRKAIYCFYDPRPGWDKDRFTRHVSARDHRWKLYENGNLYDLKSDILEQNPIVAENDTKESFGVRVRLEKVLKANTVEDKLTK